MSRTGKRKEVEKNKMIANNKSIFAHPTKESSRMLADTTYP
jgi:hypothetical protein